MCMYQFSCIGWESISNKVIFVPSMCFCPAQNLRGGGISLHHFCTSSEMITYLDKNAVSSLLSLYTVHSKLPWWYSMVVIPRDSQAKTIWLWLAFEAMTFELNVDIPSWGIQRFFSFNTATLWGHTHNDAYWYTRNSRGIFHDVIVCLYLQLWARSTLCLVTKRRDTDMTGLVMKVSKHLAWMKGELATITPMMMMMSLILTTYFRCFLEIISTLEMKVHCKW